MEAVDDKQECTMHFLEYIINIKKDPTIIIMTSRSTSITIHLERDSIQNIAKFSKTILKKLSELSEDFPAKLSMLYIKVADHLDEDQAAHIDEAILKTIGDMEEEKDEALFIEVLSKFKWSMMTEIYSILDKTVNYNRYF